MPPPHTKKYINLNCFTKITHCALKTISIAIAVLVGYFCISFANIYGNALKAQDNYIAYRANLLAQDLAENLPYNAYIVVKGSIGFSKVTNRFINKYGDISRTIKEVYKNVNWVLWYLGYHNAPYSNFGYGGDEICDFLYEKFGSEIILQNAYHKIEKSKICYIITVK